MVEPAAGFRLSSEAAYQEWVTCSVIELGSTRSTASAPFLTRPRASSLPTEVVEVEDPVGEQVAGADADRPVVVGRPLPQFRRRGCTPG